MLDHKELDKTLVILTAELICQSGYSIDDWMREKYSEFVEYGSVFEHTEEFIDEEYLEVLQLVSRFYELTGDIAKVIIINNIMENYFEEDIVFIDPILMNSIVIYIQSCNKCKYN